MAGRGLPQAEDTQPPAEVTAAIASGRPLMTADAEIDAPSRARKFVGDLSTRGTGPDHQHRALRQLAGIAVSAGMHLHDPGFWRHDGRDDRTLKRSGGCDHVGGFDRTLRRFSAKAGPAGLLV